MFACVWDGGADGPSYKRVTVAWAANCVLVDREHNPGEGDNVGLPEIECVAMWSAAVASTRFLMKNASGWTSHLLNAPFPFSSDKWTTQE